MAEDFITKEECASNCSESLDKVLDALRAHDKQAFQISEDVKALSQKVCNVEGDQRKLLESQLRTQLQLEQAATSISKVADTQKWYQTELTASRKQDEKVNWKLIVTITAILTAVVGWMIGVKIG